MISHSIYLHIPFCWHRCAYCDFNTYAGINNLIPDYVEALKREIKLSARSAHKTLSVHTVFFGGGTPSLLSVSAIDDLLQTLDATFDLDANAEISLEANPGALSKSYLRGLRSVGVNRLSIGMQSAQSGELALLERDHQFIDVISVVKWARQANFENLSLDLIFGIPEQRIEAWEGSLSLALGLNPEHFSLYALTLESGTPMQHWAARGLVSTPDPDLAAEMYEIAGSRLSAAGYVQYEISNWARENDDWRILGSDLISEFRTPHSPLEWACRHNLQYWRNQPYLGFGAGAHGFVSGFRTSNELSPATYIARLSQSVADQVSQTPKLLEFPQTPVTVNLQKIDCQTERAETMMMGLRLTQEGVSRINFRTRFDQDLKAVFGDQVDRLTYMGLLEWVGEENEVLRLTAKGRLLGNRVFREFI
jgi:oxygen-independent coproporphyrinogen-3 oxidase